MVLQNQIGFNGGVYYSDSANLDAFGRLRTSTPRSLFDAHNESGANTGSPIQYSLNQSFWMYQIDALAATQTPFSVVATSLNSVATCTAIINFKERMT